MAQGRSTKIISMMQWIRLLLVTDCQSVSSITSQPVSTITSSYDPITVNQVICSVAMGKQADGIIPVSTITSHGLSARINYNYHRLPFRVNYY